MPVFLINTSLTLQRLTLKMINDPSTITSHRSLIAIDLCHSDEIVQDIRVLDQKEKEQSPFTGFLSLHPGCETKSEVSKKKSDK